MINISKNEIEIIVTRGPEIDNPTGIRCDYLFRFTIEKLKKLHAHEGIKSYFVEILNDSNPNKNILLMVERDEYHNIWNWAKKHREHRKAEESPILPRSIINAVEELEI